jgi:hypothetical protein
MTAPPPHEIASVESGRCSRKEGEARPSVVGDTYQDTVSSTCVDTVVRLGGAVQG